MTRELWKLCVYSRDYLGEDLRGWESQGSCKVREDGGVGLSLPHVVNL